MNKIGFLLLRFSFTCITRRHVDVCSKTNCVNSHFAAGSLALRNLWFTGLLVLSHQTHFERQVYMQILWWTRIGKCCGTCSGKWIDLSNFSVRRTWKIWISAPRRGASTNQRDSPVWRSDIFSNGSVSWMMSTNLKQTERSSLAEIMCL